MRVVSIQVTRVQIVSVWIVQGADSQCTNNKIAANQSTNSQCADSYCRSNKSASIQCEDGVQLLRLQIVMVPPERVWEPGLRTLRPGRRLDR